MTIKKNTALKRLYDEFYEGENNTASQTRELVEKNILIYNNISTFENFEDFEDYSLLTTHYLLGLESAGKYTLLISIALKFIELYKANEKRLELNKNNLEQYIYVLSNLGRAYYFKKQYKKAKMVFAEVVALDTENEHLQSWLNSSRNSILISYNKYLYIIAICIYLIKIFFLSDESNSLKLSISIIAFSLILIALIIEYYGNTILKYFNKKG